MSSLDFLNDYINPARETAGEPLLRNGEMVRKLCDELDLNKTDFLLYSVGRGRPAEYVNLNYDQMMLVELELSHDEIFVMPSTGGTSPVQIYY